MLAFFFFMTTISPCCLLFVFFSEDKIFLEEPASGCPEARWWFFLEISVCLSETLQGKISWIWVGVWDLNDFNTGFKIKFRATETPHSLIIQLVWGWQNPATRILLTAHWACQVKQVLLSGESKNRKRVISESQKYLDMGGIEEDSFVHVLALQNQGSLPSF